MKKNYLTPDMETVEMKMESPLLGFSEGEGGGSGTGSGTGNPEDSLSRLLDDSDLGNLLDF